MYRHLLIKVNSKEILQFCKGSIQCLNVFTNVLEEHRIPSNIDTNERLWTRRFGANGTSLRFICSNRFWYLGTTVKLWTYWMYFSMKFFSVSFVINEKKTTVMKSLCIYFGHHSLAFLNSFLNILNKYNILVLNKYNLEYVICLLINLFLQYFGGRGSRNTNTPKKYRLY